MHAHRAMRKVHSIQMQISGTQCSQRPTVFDVFFLVNANKLLATGLLALSERGKGYDYFVRAAFCILYYFGVAAKY